MKKGNIAKYKPMLDYISRNYYPEYLSISQMIWYDHMKSVPIPIIEFKAPCIDPIDVMNNFIDKYPKVMVTGGAEPFKWTYKDPVLTSSNLAEIHKRHQRLEEIKKKEGWKK